MILNRVIEENKIVHYYISIQLCLQVTNSGTWRTETKHHSHGVAGELEDQKQLRKLLPSGEMCDSTSTVRAGSPGYVPSEETEVSRRNHRRVVGGA